jgi:3-oxoacyl-[acyl-carrier-protein] synthase II
MSKEMSKKRVVITGLGAVTPLGNTVSEYWDCLINGKSGISHVERFDTTGYTTTIAGEIKTFDTSQIVDKKEARRTSLFILYALAAATEAIKDSQLDISLDPNATGIEIGSGIGGIEILERMSVILDKFGPSKVSPFTVPMMIPDMASGFVSIKLGIKGPNSCTVTACSSATNAMGNALHWIQSGKVTTMVTGGAESAITPLGLASFCSARALSTRNESPETASCPFDLNRNGFVMGEGAGILVFEELEHARKRNAKIYAEVIGFGASGDAYHITAPAENGEGAQRALLAALDDANIQPSDVDYINAHGTSTKLNDKNETIAIKTVFGSHASALKVSSIKSMTGHLLGAAGAIEAIACAKVLTTGIIPPTTNYKTPDPDCDLDYVPNEAIEHPVTITLSNSFGFGGHNAVVAFKKYDG